MHMSKNLLLSFHIGSIFFIATFFFFSPLGMAEDKPRPILKEQVERDLQLQVSLKTPSKIHLGEPIQLQMSLWNQSKDQTYFVVKPGDGSDAGWREPYIFYTAQYVIKVDHCGHQTEEVPPETIGRCGLFSGSWMKDEVPLKPQEKLDITSDMILLPSQALKFQKPGHVRLFVHYAYQSGHGRPAENATKILPFLHENELKKLRSKEVPTGPIADMPAYEIVSSPIEIDIVPAEKVRK